MASPCARMSGPTLALSYTLIQSGRGNLARSGPSEDASTHVGSISTGKYQPTTLSGVGSFASSAELLTRPAKSSSVPSRQIPGQRQSVITHWNRSSRSAKGVETRPSARPRHRRESSGPPELRRVRNSARPKGSDRPRLKSGWSTTTAHRSAGPFHSSQNSQAGPAGRCTPGPEKTRLSDPTRLCAAVSALIKPDATVLRYVAQCI